MKRQGLIAVLPEAPRELQKFSPGGPLQLTEASFVDDATFFTSACTPGRLIEKLGAMAVIAID
eukprot:11131532-Lingulodinium_polyedra.AAC.1